MCVCVYVQSNYCIFYVPCRCLLNSSFGNRVQVLRVLRTYYSTDFAAKVRRPPWDFASNSPSLFKPKAEDGEVRVAVTASDAWGPQLLYGSALEAVHRYTVMHFILSMAVQTIVLSVTVMQSNQYKFA